MIAHHRSTLISALLGAGVVLLYLWARMALADAGPPLDLDAGPPVALVDAGAVDRIVAADHAVHLVAPAEDPPPAAKAPPSLLARAIDAAGPLGRLALGGITCLIVARLLSWQRAKRGWLRRGWAGNAAAASYGALVAFGGVLALGGSIESGLLAVGGATLYGLGLAKDPETAQQPKVPPPSEEVPT